MLNGLGRIITKTNKFVTSNNKKDKRDVSGYR